MFDSDFIEGECNGQNIYDVDWDHEHENYDSNGLPYKFQWFTKDKKVLTLQEMSNEHLENALKYEFKKKGQFTYACACLNDELKWRHDAGFFNQTRDCPFCGGVMEVVECRMDVEVGFSFPKYQFSCKCGGTSNYIDRTFYKSIIK